MRNWQITVIIIAAFLTILYGTYTIGHVRGFQACTDYVVEEIQTRKTTGASGTADFTRADVDSLPVDSAGNVINPWTTEK